MMQGCKALLLLVLGLCLALDYVTAGVVDKPRVYSNNILNQVANMADQLDQLKKRQAALEYYQKNQNTKGRSSVDADLFNVQKAIAYIENTSTVSYQDYLKLKKNHEAQYEKDMKELQKNMDKAKQEEKATEYALFKHNYDELAAQKQKIADEFAKYLKDANLNQVRINQIKDKIQQEKEETVKTLEAAKQKHARAVEAFAANPNEGYKPVRIPEQATINKLKQELKQFVSMKDKKKLNEGLLLTKTKLSSLLPALYEGSKFKPDTDRTDIEEAISVMEMNTLIVKDEQYKHRKELLDKMTNKELTDLSDQEIDSLRKINDKLAVTDMFRQEVGNRSAYAKGLLEVLGLLTECSDAIEASKQGKIAKFLSDAVEEAKKGNLAKLWARA